VNSERIREQIRKNAIEIARLHSRINETVARRPESSERKREWEDACAEFHARYDKLAFPTGYKGGGALRRIEYGDPEAVEVAICFLEVRPYFFRSGYMFKDILRTCRRAPLSPDQAARLRLIEERLAEWKQRKSAKKRAMH
jgi:hypothetical protein